MAFGPLDIDAMRRGAEAPVRAGPADLPAVAADLADAFTGDVMFDWILRDDARRAEALARFFKLIVRMSASDGSLIERPAAGGAVAIWTPFAAIKPPPLIEELRALPTLLYATGLSRFARLLAFRADTDAHHPMDRPHAYLWFLGVRRDAQGRGLGSRLLKVATTRLDAAGEPAYLETQTERNIGLYRRHGFEVVSEHRPRADSPPIWSMWREPKETLPAT